MIVVKGAREHNLKGVDVSIPRGTLTTITGVSGSGKSSLAFDTIHREGQRRFLESLSSYARQFLGGIDRPRVEHVEGLSPSVSIDQKTVSRSPRSTVGTITELYDYLRLLFGRLDGFWELHLNAWDVAAGILLVREAGGRVTDFLGDDALEPLLFSRHIVATNGSIHDDLRSRLAPLTAL